MSSIMLARAAHVQMFTNLLQRIGAPVTQELAKIGLPSVPDIDPNNYVPVLPALRFFKRMEAREGIDDLGFRASTGETLDCLDSGCAQVLLSAPTLYSRFKLFEKLARAENTNCRVTVIREGCQIRVCNDLVGYPDLNGLRYSEWIQIIVMVEIIRTTTGTGWSPTEITFQSRFRPCDQARRAFSNTRFITGQPHSSITVPAALISRNLRTSPSDRSTHSDAVPSHAALTKLDFPATLKLTLRSYLAAGHPNIELASEIACTSVRTLQRRLSRFGIDYKTLVQQTRFEVATELLEDQGLNMDEIANATGYSDGTHFARAFRQIAGVSPSEYRRQLAETP